MRVATTVHAPCVFVLFSSEADFSTGVNNILGGILFSCILTQNVSSFFSTLEDLWENLSCKEIHRNCFLFVGT